MFCENCGRELREGAEFCTSCGAKRPQTAGNRGGNLTSYPQYPSNSNANHYNGVPQGQRREAQYPGNNANYYDNNAQYARPARSSNYRDSVMRAGAPHIGASFPEAISLFFKNYANFKGRASRSEFWWVALAEFLFYSVLFSIMTGSMMANIVSFEMGDMSGLGATFFVETLITVALFGLLVPNLALIVRRLHDIGKEWYWLFMVFIPAAGPIIMIVFYCTDSDADNQWGYGPRRRYRDMNR